MRKRPLIYYLFLFFFTIFYSAKSFSYDNTDKIARALTKRLTRMCYKVDILDHKTHPIIIYIDTKKQTAFFMTMGHELFRAQARYIDLSPKEISIAKNWIEIRGNGRDKIYLDILKKILFFKVKNNKKISIFANVKIEKRSFKNSRNFIVLKILNHSPISINIFLSNRKGKAHKKAYVFFGKFLPFITHATKIKIRGASLPLIRLKYMEKYKDGIFLNLSRKILYFRSNKKGIFAYVKIKKTVVFVGNEDVFY